MIKYGKKIKKDKADIKILVKCSAIEEYIKLTEEKFYCLLDSVEIGSELYIRVFDGYGYNILSFISIIASNIDKNMLKEKIKGVLQDWKKNQ